MAVRTVVLWIGDDLVRGTRPQSELAAINPTYDDPQTGLSRIWNIQTQTWQDTTPGVNTDTVSAGSDKWGPESRCRAALALRGAPWTTGYVDHIKFAVSGSSLLFADLRRNVDGTAAAGTLKPCWSPQARDTSGYAGLIAQVKAAKNSAALAGDTLAIKAIVIGLGIEDWFFENVGGFMTGQSSFGLRMRDLIFSLFIDLQFVAGVSVSSIRDGFSLPQVTVLLPHTSLSAGLSENQRGAIQTIRTDLTQLRSPIYRVEVLQIPTLSSVDGRVLTAAALVELGEQIPATWFEPEAPDDTGLTSARLCCSIGDSIAEGSGTPVPSYLSGALTGVHLLARNSLQFETYQIGVNAGVSANPATVALGFEAPLAVRHRDDAGGDVWWVKCSMIGSSASAMRERSPLNYGPLNDAFRYSWDPACFGSLCDTFLHWLRTAVAELRAAGKAPAPDTFYVSLGTNDILVNASLDVDAKVEDEAFYAIQQLRRRVDQELEQLELSLPDWVFLVPSSSLSTKQALVTLREKFQSWQGEDPKVHLVDLTGISTSDGIHPDANGALAVATAAWALRDSSEDRIRPLFAASTVDLKRALRLSQVPDSNDAVYLIDSAMASARGRLYRSLGEARLAEILDMPLVQNPTTEDHYTRALAVTVETKMVRQELLRTMPTMFMDGASTVQSWNQEAAFREGGYVATQREINRLEDDIREALSTLVSGTISVGQAETLAPETFHDPGNTLRTEVF